jgi:microtubule-associated protein-like 6
MATRQTYPAPDSYKNSKTEAITPEATLELEHVFGYRCHDVRNNLRYTADGMVVYHCAAVGVVLD